MPQATVNLADSIEDLTAAKFVSVNNSAYSHSIVDKSNLFLRDAKMSKKTVSESLERDVSVRCRQDAVVPINNIGVNHIVQRIVSLNLTFNSVCRRFIRHNFITP